MSLPIEWTMVEQWVLRSSRFFVKKLSKNDTSWADGLSNQAGPYVPAHVRESNFFPELQPHDTIAHISRVKVLTIWPQTGEVKNSSVSHYKNKGPEAHLTWVPYDVFKKLSPASWLVGGLLTEPEDECAHWFLVIDSKSKSAELLETALDLPADFQSGDFKPSDLGAGYNLAEAESQRLAEELRAAILGGTLSRFLRDARIPGPTVIAGEAQKAYLDANGLRNLDPFAMSRPGDAVMKISRDLEFEIYKRHELRLRAAEIAGALIAHPHDPAETAVRGFSDLYGIFLSTSQQRKTRAGRSFEFHIATMLTHGRIRFQEQAVTGGRRPDFVLPEVTSLREPGNTNAFVLSCKTTLKERWKQVMKERFDAPIFLATVDDRVPASAIADMDEFGVTLVVPEAFKIVDKQKPGLACYATQKNVISFKDLFEDEIRRRRPALILGFDLGGAADDLFSSAAEPR